MVQHINVATVFKCKFAGNICSIIGNIDSDSGAV
jgi:hypothetical protein